MTAAIFPLPSLLFCPGDQPDRFEKALRSADGVILDLEDAVLPDGRKEVARDAVVRAVQSMDMDRVVVRVNAFGSPWHQDDVEAIVDAGVRTVMLPKATAPEDIARLAPLHVIALCETAAGFLAAQDIAATANCVGMMWGAEDLLADLGGHRSRGSSGSYLPVVQHARMHLLLSAVAGGSIPIDGVYLGLEGEGLVAEATEAAAMGFAGKVAIHPEQVSRIRASFLPSTDLVQWAHRILAQAEIYSDRGAFMFEGEMVDRPLLEHARQILAREANDAGR